jgi:hypothetical protein
VTGCRLTRVETQALQWLDDHDGDGVFDIYGLLFAQGEIAPFMHWTWDALCWKGFVEYYGPPGNKWARCRRVY